MNAVVKEKRPVSECGTLLLAMRRGGCFLAARIAAAVSNHGGAVDIAGQYAVSSLPCKLTRPAAMEGSVVIDVERDERRLAPGSTMPTSTGKNMRWRTLGSLTDMMNAEARSSPDRPVVCLPDGSVKYTLGVLNSITDALAMHFIRIFGCRKGSPIAIFMDKSPEYVVAYIAALKTGR